MKSFLSALFFYWPVFGFAICAGVSVENHAGPVTVFGFTILAYCALNCGLALSILRRLP